MSGTQEDFVKDVRGRGGASDRPWQGYIMNAAASPSSDVYVVIPDLDPHGRRGPCMWNPVPGVGGIWVPGGGETALVEFDNEKDPWITQWIPDSGSVKL